MESLSIERSLMEVYVSIKGLYWIDYSWRGQEGMGTTKKCLIKGLRSQVKAFFTNEQQFFVLEEKIEIMKMTIPTWNLKLET